MGKSILMKLPRYHINWELAHLQLARSCMCYLSIYLNPPPVNPSNILPGVSSAIRDRLHMVSRPLLPYVLNDAATTLLITSSTLDPDSNLSCATIKYWHVTSVSIPTYGIIFADLPDGLGIPQPQTGPYPNMTLHSTYSSPALLVRFCRHFFVTLHTSTRNTRIPLFMQRISTKRNMLGLCCHEALD